MEGLGSGMGWMAARVSQECSRAWPGLWQVKAAGLIGWGANHSTGSLSQRHTLFTVTPFLESAHPAIPCWFSGMAKPLPSRVFKEKLLFSSNKQEWALLPHSDLSLSHWSVHNKSWARFGGECSSSSLCLLPAPPPPTLPVSSVIPNPSSSSAFLSESPCHTYQVARSPCFHFTAPTCFSAWSLGGLINVCLICEQINESRTFRIDGTDNWGIQGPECSSLTITPESLGVLSVLQSLQPAPDFRYFSVRSTKKFLLHRIFFHPSKSPYNHPQVLMKTAQDLGSIRSHLCFPAVTSYLNSAPYM